MDDVTFAAGAVENVTKIEVIFNFANKKRSAFNPRKAVQKEQISTYEFEESWKKVKKPKFVQAKLLVQRLQYLQAAVFMETDK